MFCGSLNLQSNGIITVTPNRSILFFGANTSKPAGHKVMGPGNKHFASGLLGIIVGGATLTSTLCFLEPSTLTIGETTYIRYRFRANTVFWITLSQN